jgi:putative ABC transport system substrate-binding protein
MRRRDIITLLGGAAVWPLAAQAQQPTMPVVGFVNGGARDASTHLAAAFVKGLSETGYIDGQNVRIDYYWLEGQYEQSAAVVADLVRRRVAVIAAPGFPTGALAAKAATATIPIVFGVGEDPVKLGLVASFARPGQETTSKRLGLLHELVPKAAHIAVLVNPVSPVSLETTLKDVQEAADVLGLQIHVFRASTNSEIDVAFTAFTRERIDALFIANDGFFASRRGQFATLTARDRLPASYGAREMAEAGVLMTYGANVADSFRQVGIYTGSILKGTKPADLPVIQSTKFESAGQRLGPCA